MNEDVGRVASPPGSREPSPSVSAASGFDPSRDGAAYWRGRYEGFIEALRKTYAPEQLAEMGIV